jgi:ubiquinone/menaquinone biosynthesis C-methylase UbiE
LTGAIGKVKQHYDEVAEIYDNRYDQSRGREYYRHICRHVLACIPGGGRILDLGCGTGLFLTAYEQGGGSGVGLDISRGMLERARSRCSVCEVTVGNAEILPFTDESFDAVSSLLAFSYVRHPENLLEETYRVLRPGGSLAICTLGKHLLTTGLPAVYTLAEVMKLRKIGMGAFGERYYDRTEMYDLLGKAGFTGIRIKRCSFAHLNLVHPLFGLAQKIEPIVEERIPHLAYNILASGKKPEK